MKERVKSMENKEEQKENNEMKKEHEEKHIQEHNKEKELNEKLSKVKDELEEMQSGASALDGDMLNEMREVVTGLKNHPVEYNDLAVRQLIECIKVMSADTIHIYFKDGTKIEATL